MKLIRSFKSAFSGLLVAFKEQRNLRVHFLLSIGVIALGAYFKITQTEWLILLLTISLVISLELVNSSIENLTDLVTKEKNPLAGKVKDMAAAAVLFSVIVAVVIGCIIFSKYFFKNVY